MKPPVGFDDESHAIQLSGSAGDILIFDADLIHAGSLNRLGSRRRALLVAAPLRPAPGHRRAALCADGACGVFEVGKGVLGYQS
ncbi:hypothetical protein [Metapseudomonas otitidis]|uniref:hypothetical protein n=1 Tax=Metapseudomonas otitidis TaxID=319939 RepID=UPI0037CB225F